MTTFAPLIARVRALPPLATDLLVVAVVGVFTTSDVAVNDPAYRQADWFTWLLLVVSLAALAWRRRWPVPVAAVTGAACAGWALYGHIGELLNLPFIVALYTVAALGDRRRTLWTGLVVALASGVVALIVGRDVVNPQGLPLLEMLWPLVPLLLGEVVRTRRELLDAYAARAARAEADREREAERRVHEERVRIARELHDIVAHTVAAMTVQAGVALDAFDARPEMARGAMRQVRESGKQAVRELRATVTVLREPDGESAAPAPGLDRLPELVGRFEGSGVRVALRQQEGVAGQLAPMAELAAYRIVQEALTNVVKHSGARHAAVSVEVRDGRLVVEVVDDGAPSVVAPGGFGLIGMRERATAVGGTVKCGPVAGGGFRVRAALPVRDTAGAAPGAGTPPLPAGDTAPPRERHMDGERP
ncbi:sensor histidine kinase [Streptomyces aureoverticillatus]|uniref:sensor histidine kinase n=1 Tax=Streptomyces aureoverticillatus TaxID=66871 RepID=UPI0013DA6603|nr:sensor histidine kinase [Streptomyces aureoverticillatus]QIB48076.1 sensor histidine kinase [Streptomyces aureoverticillatus]